jgi:hypothetical protein
VWRGGARLGSWTETTRLTSGAYLSLSTDTTDASFDDIFGEQQFKYYSLLGKRIAMRDYAPLYWLLTDQLWSTAQTINAAGTAEVGELRYKAWGEAS